MRRAAVVIVLAFISTVSLANTSPVFTDSEQQWIRQHPVVRYAIDPYWPMEYLENGEHKGLTRDYIDQIARVSGLRFQRVDSPNWSNTLDLIAKDQLDLSSAVSRHLISPTTKQKLLLSDEFFVGATIVVTRSGEPVMFSANRLNGKTVAVKGGGAYERYLRKHFPQINLLLITDPEQALEALADGSADAVVGLDAVLQPIITRKFLGTLHLAGVLAEMPVINVMGINPKYPELLSIINKSLLSVTSELSDNMVDRWIAKTNYGAPSWGVIIRYYSLELIFALICVVAISVFASRARTAQRRAQQSEAAKTAFMAMMSHEIRTPMNGVLSSIELLQSFEMTAPQRELTTLANVSARNLLEMLDDVLDISKLEAKGISIEHLPTDLSALARGLADIHRLAAINRNTSLSLDIDGLDDILPLVDPTRIRQVISNLLSNAVKFTQNGEVVLYVRFHASGPDIGTLKVEVRDTGIGIDQAQQSRLFKAFVQADNSITRRYGGSGLGLSICKQLVQLMGGRIYLTSAPDQGTCVGFNLTLNFEMKTVEMDLSAHPAQPVLNTPAITQQQVLVVEDHPINQRTISLQLQELGYRTMIVGDGVSALNTLYERCQEIAIVLLDCHLPDMDGYEVARRIRKLEKEHTLTHIPIIAISASTNEEHQRKCLESGIDGQLSKPLDLAGLRRLFELWLPVESVLAPIIQPPTTASSTSEMHDLFLESSHEDTAQLRDALEKNDVARARHYAHRLHGSALAMKDSDLVMLARDLEESLSAPFAADEHSKRFLKTLECISAHLANTALTDKT